MDDQDLMNAIMANYAPAQGIGYRPDVQANIDALTSIGPQQQTPGGLTYDTSNGYYVNPISGLPFFNSQYHSAQSASANTANNMQNRTAWEMGQPGFNGLFMLGATAAGGGFANGGQGWGATNVGSAAPTGAVASDGLAPITVGQSMLPGGIPSIAAAAANPAMMSMPAGVGALAGMGGQSGGGFFSRLGDSLFGNGGGTGGSSNLMDWLGFGANALGGYLQSGAEKDAAASLNPWNVNGMFGSAQFDPSTRTANYTMDPTMAGLRNQLGGATQGMLGGMNTQPFNQFAMSQGNEALPGLFGDLQGALGNMPQGAFNQYQNQMGQAMGMAGQDVSGIMNNRLDLLRQQAKPGEEQAYNSLENRLFSQGRMGSTGGNSQLQAFAKGLGEADLTRQLAAQDLGLQTQGMNLNQAGMFGNLAGQNFQGALGYNDLGANRAAQRMQNAMQLFGFGNQLQQQQMQSGLGGLTGMLGMDQSMQNSLALGGNLRAPYQQAVLAGNSPLGGLLGGIGEMAGLYSQNRGG